MDFISRQNGFEQVQLLMELKKYDLALAEVEKLIVESPDDAYLWYLRANVYYDTGNLSLSLSALEKALGLDPNHPASHNLKGAIFLVKSNYNKAKKCFETAISFDPNEALYYSNLGTVYLEIRKYDKAIEFSKQALSLAPDDEKSFNNLYWAYTGKGKKARANAILKENLARNPENLDTVNNLGFQLYNKADYRNAEEVFRSILSQNPEDTDASRGLGLVIAANNGLMDLIDKKWFEQFLKVLFIATIFLVQNIIRFAEAASTLLLILPIILALVFNLRSIGMASGKLSAFLKQKQFRAQFLIEELLFSIISILLYITALVGIVFIAMEAFETKGIDINAFLIVFYMALFPINFALRIDWNSQRTRLKWLLLTICIIAAILSIIMSSLWWIAFVGSLAIMTLDVFVAKGLILRRMT